MKPSIITATIIVSLFFSLHASPQSAEAQPNANGQSVSLIQTVEPSFRIEPVVLRFGGRRGAIIPFEFLITSTGKAMEITVQSINLQQEESGIIIPSPDLDPLEGITFSSETAFALAPGDSRLIQGEIKVPLAKTNYLSYGILVKDEGSQPRFKNDDGSDATETQAGIRFVTQYVLRVDIETDRSAELELRNMRFKQGRVQQVDGYPMATVLLDNPTEYSFECNVKGTIRSPVDKSRPNVFLLGMYSRAKLPGTDRHLIRIMPKSKLRLFAPVEDPLFPGSHILELGISNGRRQVVAAEFEVEVQPGDFPAMETAYAYLGNNVSISPAQIQLGQIKGESRTIGVKLVNNSPEVRKYALEVESLGGDPLETLQISSKPFEVKPGRSKSLRAILKSQRDKQDSDFGWIKVNSIDEDGSTEVSRLPVSLLYNEPQTPELEYSDVQLVNEGGKALFQIIVENKGDQFVPIHGDMELAHEQGERMNLAAGFGRWIAPGQRQHLQFIPLQNIAAGKYQITTQIKTFPDEPPLNKTVIVDLTPQGSDLTQGRERRADGTQRR